LPSRDLDDAIEAALVAPVPAIEVTELLEPGAIGAPDRRS